MHLLPDVDWRRGLGWLGMSAGLIVAAAAVAGLWFMSTGPTALVTGNLKGGPADDIAYSLFDSGLVVSPLSLVHRTDVTDQVTIHY